MSVFSPEQLEEYLIVKPHLKGPIRTFLKNQGPAQANLNIHSCQIVLNHRYQPPKYTWF